MSYLYSPYRYGRSSYYSPSRSYGPGYWSRGFISRSN